MDYKDIDFPQYRKLLNEKSFYRITDGRNFDEIQSVGSIKRLYQFSAEKYPEMLRIKDMINIRGYAFSSELEFERLLAQIAE